MNFELGSNRQLIFWCVQSIFLENIHVCSMNLSTSLVYAEHEIVLHCWYFLGTPFVWRQFILTWLDVTWCHMATSYISCTWFDCFIPNKIPVSKHLLGTAYQITCIIHFIWEPSLSFLINYEDKRYHGDRFWVGL